MFLFRSSRRNQKGEVNLNPGAAPPPVLTTPPGTVPPVPPTTPPLPPAPTEPDATDADIEFDSLAGDRSLSTLPRSAQDYILKIRGESKGRKEQIRAMQYERQQEAAKLAAQAAELEVFRRKEAAQKQAELEAKGKYDEALQLKETQATTEANALRASLIKKEIMLAASAMNIPPNMLEYIPHDGIIVERDGSVRGVQQVLQAFEQKNADILNAWRTYIAQNPGVNATPGSAPPMPPGTIQAGALGQPGAPTGPAPWVTAIATGQDPWSAAAGGQSPVPRPINNAPVPHKPAVTPETSYADTQKKWNEFQRGLARR